MSLARSYTIYFVIGPGGRKDLRTRRGWLIYFLLRTILQHEQAGFPTSGFPINQTQTVGFFKNTEDDTLSPGHASTSFRLPSQQPPEDQQTSTWELAWQQPSGPLKLTGPLPEPPIATCDGGKLVFSVVQDLECHPPYFFLLYGSWCAQLSL